MYRIDGESDSFEEADLTDSSDDDFDFYETPAHQYNTTISPQKRTPTKDHNETGFETVDFEEEDDESEGEPEVVDLESSDEDEENESVDYTPTVSNYYYYYYLIL